MLQDDLVGMTVRNSEGAVGRISGVKASTLRIQWLNEGVLNPKYETLAISDRKSVSKLELLTLMDGWKPMSEATEKPGTARSLSLVEDLENLLAEDVSSEPLEEAAKKSGSKSKASGKSMEKKAREKRRSRAKGGGGAGKHNPFKTKKHLGPGPRSGENSQTRKWKCACPTPYKCLCKAGKKRKTVRIKRAYKKDYNKEYKQFRKKQKH